MDHVIQALSETLFPATTGPLDGGSPGPGAGPDWAQNEDYLHQTGARHPQVVQTVRSIIDNHLYGPSQASLKQLLGLMSHRLPMLLLAGQHCLSARWPFILSLPEMPVAQRHAMLRSWARSSWVSLRQAYKGIKAIAAVALFSHIDPTTQTNPFYKGIGFVPGNAADTGVGPPAPGTAELEELLSTGTIHLPDVLATKGGAEGAQAYLTKRGFHTSPPQAPGDSCSNSWDGSTGNDSSSGSIHLFYDAVIAGSGAGGGITAAVLAAAGLKVLVLEKASWVRCQDMSWVEREAFDTMFDAGGFLSTDDGGISIMAGATMGGGTKINWTASLRTPTHVRQEWASAPHGLTQLGPDSQAFDAAMDTVCKRLGVHTGTSLSPINAKLCEGLSALGQHVEELPHNCLSTTCSGYCTMGCRTGHKQTSEVWLSDAVRAGAHVLTGVQADRVLTCKEGDLGGDRAVGLLAAAAASTGHSTAAGGVTTARDPVRVVVHAGVVVSSCGSIHTPTLLLRSGITAGGNVGAHLRLHPANGCVAVFPRSHAQAAAGQGSVQPDKGITMGWYSTAAANCEAGGYGALLSVPCVKPGVLAAMAPDYQLGYLKELMMQREDASLTVVWARDMPQSTGRVSTDSQGRPVVSYWPCPTTRKHIMEGIILAMRAMAAAGATRIVCPNAVEPWDISLDPEADPQAQQQRLEDLFARMREVGINKYELPLFSAHQTGSCRMGACSSSSACNPAGEVWGVSGLYVADGSVFPTPSGVNPMITIYAVSYLTAQGIATRWREEAAAQAKVV